MLEQREAVADRVRQRVAAGVVPVATSGLLLGVAGGRAAGRLEDAQHAHAAGPAFSRQCMCSGGR